MSADELTPRKENAEYTSDENANDDDLTIVEDDLTVVSEDAATVDESKLQLQAGINGLEFKPSRSSSTDAYSLDLNGSYETSNAAQKGSTNDAPAIAPPSPALDKNDVYSLAEPAPLPYAPARVEQTSETGKKEKKDKKEKKSKKTKYSDDDDSSLSLEELYARRRREAEDEEIVLEKRRELPERPFWDELLTPFCSMTTLIKLGLVSCAAFLPLFLATVFFTRTLAGDVQTMLQESHQLSALSAFIECIWQDKVIFLMLCFSWGVFSTPYSFHVFTETASGSDEFNEWPEYSFLGGLGQFLWILCLIFIGGLPGLLLFSLLHLNPTVGYVCSTVLLTPIFYLSCMQADGLFVLITKDVALSLKRVKESWLCFFGISYALLFASIAFSLFMIWFAVDNHVTLNPGERPGFPSLGKSAFIAALMSIGMTFFPALYLRVLGRLAWIIEDDVRKRAEQEEEDDVDESYEEGDEDGYNNRKEESKF